MSSAQPNPEPERTPTEGPADWLVGPEEGLAAELDRSKSKPAAAERPKLLRMTPEGGVQDSGLAFTTSGDEIGATGEALKLGSRPPAAAPPPPAKRIGAVQDDANDDSGFVRGPAMTWEPGTKSVPELPRNDRPRAAAEPSAFEDFPMDDAEERARERAALLAHPPAASDTFTPVEVPAHEVVSPEAFDIEDAPLPWYVSIVHTLRTDRRLQVLVGVVTVALCVVALWPRGPRPTSIGRLRRHPERFDGARVLVEGKVGQVFQVGGGWSFYLFDGRDSLVVFTRSRTPHERQHLRVSGTMSNGYLDGQPTLALFEEPEADK